MHCVIALRVIGKGQTAGSMLCTSASDLSNIKFLAGTTKTVSELSMKAAPQAAVEETEGKKTSPVLSTDLGSDGVQLEEWSNESQKIRHG